MLEQILGAALAIVLGVGGMVAYYFGANLLIDQLRNDDLKRSIRPWIFVFPALAVLAAFLVFPSLNTLYLSFTDDNPRTDVEIRVPALYEEEIRAEIIDRRGGEIDEITADGDFLVVDGTIREEQISTVGDFMRELTDDAIVFVRYEDNIADVRFTDGFNEAVQAAIVDAGGEITEDGTRGDYQSFQVDIDPDGARELINALDGLSDDAVSTSIIPGGQQFFVLDNYEWAFTDPNMVESFGNNLLWLILVPALSTALGLIIAVLADRVRWENLAKALIFLPMAISFVGASVIWRFIYFFRPEGEEQIGLLNAVATSFGGEPVAWLTEPFINNIALIVILIWIQTGFAMVLLSAALKGVPDETIEAARIDGASEVRIFFNIIIPQVMNTIAVVMTTIIILVLKVFDIPFVMTSGEFGTEVLANVMFSQMFVAGDFPRGSVVAIILMVAVLPVMYINIRRFRREEAFR